MVEAFGWIRGEKVVTKVGTEHVWPDAVTENSNFAKNFSRPAWIVPHLPDFFLAGWRFLYHAFLLAIPAMVFSPDNSSIHLDDWAANSQHRQIHCASQSVNGLSFAIVDAGPPPCRWSWISLPSQRHKRRGSVIYLIEIHGKVDFFTSQASNGSLTTTWV